MTRDYRNNRAFKAPKQNRLSVLNAILIFLLGYLTANFLDLKALNDFFKEPDVVHRNRIQKNAHALKPKFEFYTLLANEEDTKSKDKSAVLEVQASKKTNTKQALPDFKPIEASIAKRLMAHGNMPPKELSANTVVENYMVQMGAFRSQADAEKLKGALILKGFNTRIAMTSQQNLHLYRVLVGPFNSKQEAQNMQKTLANSERINGMLVSIKNI